MAHLCRLACCAKVVSYLRYCGRTGLTTAIAVFDPTRPSTVHRSMRDNWICRDNCAGIRCWITSSASARIVSGSWRPSVRDGILDLAGGVNHADLGCQPDRARRDDDRLRPNAVGGIATDDCNARQRWCHILDPGRQLAKRQEIVIREPREIAARMREAADEAAANRVVDLPRVAESLRLGVLTTNPVEPCDLAGALSDQPERLISIAFGGERKSVAQERRKIVSCQACRRNHRQQPWTS